MISRNNFIICVILFVNIYYSYGQIGCSFSYKNDLADKEPVFLKNSKLGNEILEAVKPEIVLQPKEEILIACPGPNNKIIPTSKNIETIKCDQGKKITINGKQHEIKNIACDKRPTGQTLDSQESCGKSGYKKYIGHKLGEKFYKLFYVCYDQKEGNTLYSKHTIQGASINHDKQNKIEGSFKIAGLDFRVKPEMIYTEQNLKKIFTNLLGSKQIAEKYINSKSTLAKSQLSPKSDFIYKTSQYIPYFYVNTIPVWSQINYGNLDTLEKSIRHTASLTNENFKITTGFFDILNLKNDKEKDIEIYLDVMKTLPVPKNLYKIVYSPSKKKGIAFVTINDPFMKTAKPQDYICKDICNQNDWGNTMFKQPEKGITYCCDVKEFLTKVKNVPTIGEITGILPGKSSSTKPNSSQPPRVISGCYIDYKMDFPNNQPILLKKNGQSYELYKPQSFGLTLQFKEELTLLCPGSSNKISELKKNLGTIACASGQLFRADNKPYQFKELSCNSKVNTEYRLTKTECLGRGLIKEYGHKIDDKNFVVLLTVCYDHKNGIPLYSEHTLYAADVKTANIVSQNIDYKVAGLELRVNAEEDYKTANQKILFEKLLGSTNLATKYINKNSYLARAHLSPSADFVYSTSKYASYFYINTVPQWQIINNGNWKSLENAIRTTVSSLKKPFEIITGGYKTLTLDDSKGNSVEIHLDILKMLPVPKFIWKVVYSPETKKGIAFISLNNPFVNKIQKEDYICPDICKNHGWANPEWEKKERGIIYCCEIKEFVKVVDGLPSEITTISSVLAANKN